MWLQVLIEQHGTAAALADALGVTAPRIAHLRGGKGMGERTARGIEKRLRLPSGFMDRHGEIPDAWFEICARIAQSDEAKTLHPNKLAKLIASALRRS